MKLGSGQIRYDIESVELGEVLQSIDQLIRPQMDAKRLHFEYTGAGPGVRVLADRDKLHQIVLNLLSNASKFTDAGGIVHLGCTVDEWIVTITVRDTGCGIPADQLQRVFEPFVQVHRSTGGTGLGLAISRDFARAMGGDMVLTSEVGRGSTFTVSLPRAQP
jgi:signal transduction histidine kinase